MLWLSFCIFWLFVGPALRRLYGADIQNGAGWMLFFFFLALHISLVVVGIFLFIFYLFFCRCWLSIGSLVAYWSPVEGHSCFRDVNTTVILQAADSRNYVPVILATWKLKRAFIIDKMGCHVPLLFRHIIFSKTSKKYLTQSYVTDCFTSSLAFLCYPVSARSLMMSTIVTLLYCESFHVANVVQEFKSLWWSHSWKRCDNERVAIVSRGVAGVTLSRFCGAPRRYGLTTSVKCPSKGESRRNPLSPFP